MTVSGDRRVAPSDNKQSQLAPAGAVAALRDNRSAVTSLAMRKRRALRRSSETLNVIREPGEKIGVGCGDRADDLGERKPSRRGG